MEGRSECLLAMLRGVGCNINYLPEWGFKIKFSGGEKCPGGEKKQQKTIRAVVVYKFKF